MSKVTYEETLTKWDDERLELVQALIEEIEDDPPCYFCGSKGPQNCSDCVIYEMCHGRRGRLSALSNLKYARDDLQLLVDAIKKHDPLKEPIVGEIPSGPVWGNYYKAQYVVNRPGSSVGMAKAVPDDVAGYVLYNTRLNHYRAFGGLLKPQKKDARRYILSEARELIGRWPDLQIELA
ncbi:MAG: hypothetical protein GY853_13510 [PVC group bacterium]|nr:hypothetical protein [PVC group bacterium]